MAQWDLVPGQRVVRRELHDRYGGGRYGGIEPSARTPNLFLFTDPSVGEKYGYNFDGWHADGTFHYTGEGQVGDQIMRDGNRAVRFHLDQGRALRLFRKDGAGLIYLGQFEVPNESHVILEEARDRNGLARSVFVFRLRPVGNVVRDGDSVAPPLELTRAIPLEAHDVDEYVMQRAASEPRQALRREAQLVERFVEWVTSSGLSVERQAIPTPGGRPMFTDVCIKEKRELVEAKGASSREHIRGALGQILDYARYVDHSLLTVLLPTQPSEEMVSLLIAHGVGCSWETDRRGEFATRRPVA